MRTEGVGKFSAAEAINWGVTGPNLRACGVNVDLRRLDPYEVYEGIDFEPQVWHDGGSGDSYARFVCRFNELRESCQIILQALEKMPKTGPYRAEAPPRAGGEGSANAQDSAWDRSDRSCSSSSSRGSSPSRSSSSGRPWSTSSR